MSLNQLLMLLLPVLALCNRSPLIEIEQGKIRGIVKSDWKGGRFYSFLKVPYAKPPIGELRFKDPQPADKWQGILEAIVDMPECVQYNWKKELVGEEDCLYMNIHTPKVATKGLKPVMVFIHGGAYVEGNGRVDAFGPEFLVPEGVVVVTIQYRLGLFGFLNFDNPKIRVPGNAGLKDQNLALKWLRRNIEIFGGDPTSITLFGESAGGASAHLHMLSPLSHGLIHRVISQSGTALHIWSEGMKNTGNHVAEVLKYPTDDEKRVLEHLQTVSVDDIMKVQENCTWLPPIHERSLVGPIVETLHSGDIFLAETPEAILTRGQFNKIPFMIGYNSNEALLFYVIGILTHGEIKTIPQHHLIPHTVRVKDEEEKNKVFEQIKKQYLIEDFKAGTDEYMKLISDVYVAYNVYVSAKEHSKINHRNLYLYKFSADTKLNFLKLQDKFTAKIPGVSHGEELGYLFKNKYTPEDLTEQSVEGRCIQRMVKLWSNFAKYGKPTPNENEMDVTWKTVTRDAMNYLDITTDSLSAKADPFDSKDMHFWDKLLGKSVPFEHTEL